MEKEQKPYKLIVVGEGGAGKRTLLLHFTRGSFYPPGYDPPIELTFDRDVVVGDESCRLALFDISSEELAVDNAWRHEQVRTADGFMLVFPINSHRAFDQVPVDRARIVELLRQGDTIMTTEPPVMMLVGSKCDKEDEREVHADQAKELARSFGGICTTYMEISSKTGTKVEEAFLELVHFIQLQRSHTMMKKNKKNKTCLLS